MQQIMNLKFNDSEPINDFKVHLEPINSLSKYHLLLISLVYCIFKPQLNSRLIKKYVKKKVHNVTCG